MRRFPALRHRDFAVFLSAHVVSRLGTQMRDVALVWHLYLLTKSPSALGILGAFRVLPVILLAPWGGASADTFDRRRLMLATQTALSAISFAMALLTSMGRASPAMLYLLVALSGATSAFDTPVRQAVVVNLLPAADLANGLTLSIFAWQIATVVGPAIGGALLGVLSVESIYLIDALSFAAVIVALLFVRLREPDVADGVGGERKGGVNVSAIREGLRFLRTKPELIWLMVLDFLATFFAGSLLLLPFFANEIFGVGVRGLGVLVSAPAVGSLAASAWLSTRAPIRRQGFVVLSSVLVYGASIALFGASKSFPLALVLLACSGAADSVSTVVRQVVRQTMTPDDLRGRMTSINMIFFMGGPQLGEAEAGLLAGLTTVRTSVVAGGIACALVAVAVALTVPTLRTLQSNSVAV